MPVARCQAVEERYNVSSCMWQMIKIVSADVSHALDIFQARHPVLSSDAVFGEPVLSGYNAAVISESITPDNYEQECK